MKQQHTQGPWVLKVRKYDNFTVAEIEIDASPYRGDVARLQSCEHIDGITKDELLANARLIAAAPELLEALEKALEMLEELKIESGRGIDWGEEDAFRMGEWFERDEIAAMKIAGAAIAKAKGEPQ
jgi:hypothetical protein